MLISSCKKPGKAQKNIQVPKSLSVQAKVAESKIDLNELVRLGEVKTIIYNKRMFDQELGCQDNTLDYLLRFNHQDCIYLKHDTPVLTTLKDPFPTHILFPVQADLFLPQLELGKLEETEFEKIRVACDQQTGKLEEFRRNREKNFSRSCINNKRKDSSCSDTEGSSCRKSKLIQKK